MDVFVQMSTILDLNDFLTFGSLENLLNYKLLKDNAEMRQFQRHVSKMQDVLQPRTEVSAEHKIVIISKLELLDNDDLLNREVCPMVLLQTAEVHAIMREVWQLKDMSNQEIMFKIIAREDYHQLIKKFEEYQLLIDLNISLMISAAKHVKEHSNCNIYENLIYE